MNNMRPTAIALLLSVAACSGNSGTTSIPTASAQTGGGTTTAAHGAASARLSIKIPSATTTTASSAKRPQYVSPSSTQMKVAVNGGAPAIYGLTTSSPGCAVATGVLSCAFTIAAPSGQDTFSIVLEDASGAALSANTVGATLAAGSTTPVNVTLAGIPASVSIVPGTNSAIEGSATPSWHFPGLLPQPIEVEPLDADGNVIIGPGAPTLQAPTVTSTNGTIYATITSAQNGDPNAYLLAPVDSTAGGQTVTVSASATTSGTASTTTSTAEFLFTPAVAFAVPHFNFVYEYSQETGKPIAQISVCAGCGATNWIKGMTSDAKGNLYIGYGPDFGAGGSVVELAPTSTTPSTSLRGITAFAGITTDTSGNVYVVNNFAGSAFGGLTRAQAKQRMFGTAKPASVMEYANGSTTPTYTLIDTNGDITSAGGIAIDSSGNVYVLENLSDYIVEYPPLQTSVVDTSTIIGQGTLQSPNDIAIDPQNNVYVSDGNLGLVEYTSPVNSSSMGNVIPGVPVSSPFEIRFDSSGNLWTSGANSVTDVLKGLPSNISVVTSYNQSGYAGWIP